MSVADTPAPSRAPRSERPALSIVIPALNEEASLPELMLRIGQELAGVVDYEVILVDDGSTDGTWRVMRQLSREPRVTALRMRRNFGKAMALSAGFSKARGEVLMTMDADLQDDPRGVAAGDAGSERETTG